ncbi:hypothetical protein [Leifsonia sp. NPDC058230]|uniref:hypothetical protein n=1 Tax=Leifsonia sp. NPDC058230 TaxID=3346391 RepID=UPI0036DDFB10
MPGPDFHAGLSTNEPSGETNVSWPEKSTSQLDGSPSTTFGVVAGAGALAGLEFLDGVGALAASVLQPERARTTMQTMADAASFTPMTLAARSCKKPKLSPAPESHLVNVHHQDTLR